MERELHRPMSAIGKTKPIFAYPHGLPEFRLAPRPKLIRKWKSLC